MKILSKVGIIECFCFGTKTAEDKWRDVKMSPPKSRSKKLLPRAEYRKTSEAVYGFSTCLNEKLRSVNV